MSGNIAAARAFLSAGNTKLALAQLEDILADDPQDPDALDAYCDTLREAGPDADALRIARDWIARAPQDQRAHIQLIVGLMRSNDRKGTRKAIDAYRDFAPWDVDALDWLETTFEARFGDQAKGLKALAERMARSGDRKNEFRFASYAAEKRSDLPEAIIEAEYARRTGDDSPELAAYLAMLCFRAFRFSKCRKYAREALSKRPGMPAPTELIYLSWLVFFPPFLFAHLCLYVLDRLRRMSGWGRLILVPVVYVAGVPTMAIFFSLAGALKPIGLGRPAMFVLFLLFVLYEPFIGLIATLLQSRRPKAIELTDY